MVCVITDAVVNGDFEQGAVGFTSDYIEVPMGVAINGETQFTVASNPATVSIWNWASFGDYTTGHGLMLIANGATAPGLAVWRETVQVQPQTTYTFSFCAAGVDPVPSGASLQGLVGGIAVGAALTVSPTPGAWTCVSATWPSGTDTTTSLSIIDLNVAALNNDFALDHVTFDGCQTPPAASTGTAL